MSASAITIAEALRDTGLDAIDARLLLQHVLGVEHAFVIAHPEHRLDDDSYRRLRDLLDRRRNGEPIAYLLGTREFYGRAFCVDRSTLIPRPETELLVEAALERLPPAHSASILDLGTGSGCIAITLALERPRVSVTAIDAAPDALATARRNATTLNAVNVRFAVSDWFAAVAAERFDLIVANPPYVGDADAHLAQGDVRFEPRLALAGGPDGLAAIRRIIGGAARYLYAGAWLLLEHGYDHGEACRRILRSAGFVDVFTAVDIAGLDRVSGGRNP
jgi:release factor glutamine methyltransferase